MHKTLLAFLAISLLPITVFADGDSQRFILKKEAFICYKRNDWDDLVSSMADTNLQLINQLMGTGKCQRTIIKMQVRFIDPVNSSASLIQMPSGRAGYVFNQDLKH